MVKDAIVTSPSAARIGGHGQQHEPKHLVLRVLHGASSLHCTGPHSSPVCHPKGLAARERQAWHKSGTGKGLVGKCPPWGCLHAAVWERFLAAAPWGLHWTRCGALVRSRRCGPKSPAPLSQSPGSAQAGLSWPHVCSEGEVTPAHIEEGPQALPCEARAFLSLPESSQAWTEPCSAHLVT